MEWNFQDGRGPWNIGVFNDLILAVDKEYHPHSIGFKKERPDSIQRDSESENLESEPEFVSESEGWWEGQSE